MSSTNVRDASLQFGRVFSRTFDVIGSNIVSFTMLSLLLYAVPDLAFRTLFAFARSAVPGGAWLVGLVGGLVAMILGFILQGCLVHGTVAYLQGKPASVGAGLGAGLRAFLPLLALSIVMGLLEMVAFFLFIIPGLVAMTVWSVAIPVLVVERNHGVSGSMDRSADLTRDNRWNVFALLLIFGILGWIINVLAIGLGGGLGAMARGAPVEGATVSLAVQSVVAALVGMVGAVGAASLYFELRSLREGVGVAELASVFD